MMTCNISIWIAAFVGVFSGMAASTIIFAYWRDYGDRQTEARGVWVFGNRAYTLVKILKPLGDPR